MLPDTKLTDEHHDLVREDFDALTMGPNRKRTTSLNEVGKAIGNSGSVVSQWYTGNYAGDMDAITRKINNWIETTRQRQRLGTGDYVETWVAEQMKAVVRMAHNKRKMACIVSPSGSGKDMVIEAMSQEFGGPVVYCEATFTPKQLLQRIAASCKLPIGGSASDITARIVAQLKGRNTILFINEAQVLKASCGGVIRSIYDQTGVTVALFGAQQIFSLIDDRANGGGQFWSRCQKVSMLEQLRYAPNPGGAGCRPLFTIEEIKALAKSKSIRLADSAVVKMLAKIACLPDFGTLRLVAGLLDDIAYFYEEDRTATVSRITQLLILGNDIEAKDICAQAGYDLPEPGQEIAAA
jgi:DNA transposition AAA+ family ATPase